MANKLITLKDSSNNNLYPMTTYNAVTDANGNNLPSDFSQIGGNVQSDWNEQDSTSGAYIKNKPSIPSALSDLSDDSTHRLVTDTEKSTWNSKSDFSGNYNDLSNKPTIPTVNDSTITFTQGGVTKGTITLNQSSATTIAFDAGGGSAQFNMTDVQVTEVD